MSEELKNLKSPGRKEDIVFFLGTVSGNNGISTSDLKILCSHAPGVYQLSCEALISYCASFGWISGTKSIQIESSLLQHMQSAEDLNYELVTRSVNKLFLDGIFNPSMFSYNIITKHIVFRNELLPLTYASIRNVLISQGFFVVNKEPPNNYISVFSIFEKMVTDLCQKTSNAFTLAQLKKKLERDSILGAKAEAFVLDYEKRRIVNPSLCEMIKIISEVDVAAGYDIISFESNRSLNYDRYIEVKAISSHEGFFWSSNEYQTAKLKGEQYYLYLINVSEIKKPEYVPTIIKTPATTIMQSEDWLVETETYHIKRV